MAEKEKTGSQHIIENFTPTVLKKNFVPVTVKPGPGQAAGHGVEGNYVPTTSSDKSNTPPPMPTKK